MTDQERTWLASVLFMDIVGYSLLSVERQLRVKEDFNARVRGALAELDPGECIKIDTGDGMALCYLGDMQPLFELARGLQNGFAAAEYEVRMGMNLGPVRVLDDVNGHRNCVGEGINTAQRIMDFAAAGQLLVSRTYYDVVVRLADAYTDLFTTLGEHRDKHGRHHDLFQLQSLAPAESASAPGAQAALDPAMVERIQDRYARYVGREQAAQDVAEQRSAAASIGELAQMLAARLERSDERDDFVEFLRYYGIGGY